MKKTSRPASAAAESARCQAVTFALVSSKEQEKGCFSIPAIRSLVSARGKSRLGTENLQAFLIGNSLFLWVISASPTCCSPSSCRKCFCVPAIAMSPSISLLSRCSTQSGRRLLHLHLVPTLWRCYSHFSLDSLDSCSASE